MAGPTKKQIEVMASSIDHGAYLETQLPNHRAPYILANVALAGGGITAEKALRELMSGSQ